MAGMTPLPPTIIHQTTRLTHAQAHTILSTFLTQADNEAAYRPDSTLTERGPQSASTGANPNLTLHHLKRILQGIEGKRIGGEDVGRFFGDGARAAGANGSQFFKGTKRKADGSVVGSDAGFTSSPPIARRARREMIEDQNPDDGMTEVGIAVGEEGDGWQDKTDYDLAQREEGLELLDDDRQPGMDLDQPADEAEVEEMLDVKVQKKNRGTQKNQEKVTDKEERKRAKKLRNEQEKKERNAKARAKADS